MAAYGELFMATVSGEGLPVVERRAHIVEIDECEEPSELVAPRDRAALASLLEQFERSIRCGVVRAVALEPPFTWIVH